MVVSSRSVAVSRVKRGKHAWFLLGCFFGKQGREKEDEASKVKEKVT